MTGTHTYLWKLPTVAFTFAFGLVVSRLIFNYFSLAPPRFPRQADESTAIYYLLAGSLILTSGLLPLIQKIGGLFSTRFLIVFSFLFACFGVSDSIESSIYSSVEGFDRMIAIFILPVLLFSLVSTSLMRTHQPHQKFLDASSAFFRKYGLSKWLLNMLTAIVSFPVIYVAFGIIVSPIVTDFYTDTAYGLTIPSFGLIIEIQLLRSTLFLIATLPIIIMWVGKRIQLILFLGFAHFVIVFSSDIVLAFQLPVTLLLTHGIEILLDSLVYSWVFVKLFVPEEKLANLD